MENNIRILNCNVNSVLQFGCENWKNFKNAHFLKRVIVY